MTKRIQFNPRILWRSVLLSIAVLVLASVYMTSREIYWQAEYERVSHRAALYNSTLVSALERYQPFPFVLARDPVVITGLKQGDRMTLNHRLEIFAKKSQVDALYVMDIKGTTIAASNWNKNPTFLGKNYGFRPYFKKAMAGERGVFFAIGVTTNLPGYFIAEPIRDFDRTIIGVIALKVDLAPLVQSWIDGGGKLFVSNADGIVVLSSNPDWRYRRLAPLKPATLKEIKNQRQFAGESLNALDLELTSDNEIRLDSIPYLHHVSTVPQMGWKLHYLGDKEVVIQRSQRALLIASILMTFLFAGYILLRSARIKRAFLASEEDGRSLRALNENLEKEIEERKCAERRLARTQKELKQTSKLAALGQLSASVSHELGQPIAAMQNYIAAADLPDSGVKGETREIINRLGRLVNRMAHITRQLKFFAGNAVREGHANEEAFVDVDLCDVIGSVQEIMSNDVAKAGVQLEITLGDSPCHVRGDRLKLEQVLINLVRNGLDAMDKNAMDENAMDKNAMDKNAMDKNNACQMKIALRQNATQAMISVSDRGPGIPDGMEEQIFDSFVSSKPSGEGMGLGLAISTTIIHDHDGELEVRSRNRGGAEFIMRLPLLGQNEESPSA